MLSTKEKHMYRPDVNRINSHKYAIYQEKRPENSRLSTGYTQYVDSE